MASEQFECRVCGKQGAPLRYIECYGPRFGRVACPRYCGEDCQASDWDERHRRECQPENTPLVFECPGALVEERVEERAHGACAASARRPPQACAASERRKRPRVAAASERHKRPRVAAASERHK